MTYVFPDCHLMPISTASRLAEAAGFEVRDVESLREHYALTARAWRRGLEANHDARGRRRGRGRLPNLAARNGCVRLGAGRRRPQSLAVAPGQAGGRRVVRAASPTGRLVCLATRQPRRSRSSTSSSTATRATSGSGSGTERDEPPIRDCRSASRSCSGTRARCARMLWPPIAARAGRGVHLRRHRHRGRHPRRLPARRPAAARSAAPWPSGCGWRARCARSRRSGSRGLGRGPARVSGRRFSLERDRKAVTYHYDSSNEFFSLYLDRRMVYTCAYFGCRRGRPGHGTGAEARLPLPKAPPASPASACSTSAAAGAASASSPPSTTASTPSGSRSAVRRPSSRTSGSAPRASPTAAASSSSTTASSRRRRRSTRSSACACSRPSPRSCSPTSSPARTPS